MVAAADSLDTYAPDTSDKAVLEMMLDRLDHGTEPHELVGKVVAWFEGALSVERAQVLAVDALAEFDFDGAEATW